MISDFLVAEWGVSMVSEFNEKLVIPRRFTVTCFNDLSSAVRWPIHMKYVNTRFFLRFFPAEHHIYPLFRS